MQILTRFTDFINTLFPSKLGFQNIFEHYFFEQKYYLHTSASLENFDNNESFVNYAKEIQQNNLKSINL